MNKPPRYTFAAFLLATIVFAAGCPSESQDGDVLSPQAGVEQPGQAPTDDEPVPDEINASHILVMYKGGERAPEDITRTKAEALALAQEIAAKTKAEGADFAALAREYSDCPSGLQAGGNLGNFSPHVMAPEFSNAALNLAVGQISNLVETPFGYHIILRQELKVIQKISAKHILVQYENSQMAPASITRTPEEALARMQECLKKAREGGKFEDLAGEYSDGPSKSDGGDLGEFPEGAMHPAFEKAAFACEVGKITEIVETPFGYHIIYRYK